jgi:hypothetical protein
MALFKLKREEPCDRVGGVLTVGQFYREARAKVRTSFLPESHFMSRSRIEAMP